MYEHFPKYSWRSSRWGTDDNNRTTLIEFHCNDLPGLYRVSAKRADERWDTHYRIDGVERAFEQFDAAAAHYLMME